MNSLILVVICFIGYLAAYKIYGRFLGRKIFRLDDSTICPSTELYDGTDFVPAKKGVLFGHHFTSIAGLGPIVGPAIAIIWGWVPAVIWIFFGSIFMGAVHDFGVLVLSIRNKGCSIGDIAGDLISNRIRFMFLLIMFIANLMVITVFILIIAILFDMYPSSVLPVWSEVPIAILLGYFIYKKKFNHIILSLLALLLLFVFVIIGAYLPVRMPEIAGLNPLVIWAIILFIYAYVVSILPVTTLLQPRDYINSHQLFVVLFLLVIGVIIAHPPIIAPAIDTAPKGAPPIIPFLFIIIACGAISGFHSLVSSGTSSKQCEKETDALAIGYGGMIMEGTLSILVIIAVSAGLGLGLETKDGSILTGSMAFSTHYSSWASAAGLGAKLKAFVVGSSNLMGSYGIPPKISITIMGVFLVSFAATTLDSATRIQRYIVRELAKGINVKSLSTQPATLIAVGVAALLCFHDGFSIIALKRSSLSLWPLFGVTNQLLATLALFAITVYLAKRNISIKFTLIPAVFMLFVTGWGSIANIQKFLSGDKTFLLVISLISFLLEIWIIFEAFLTLKRLSIKQY